MKTLDDVDRLVAELPERQKRVFYDRQAVLKTAFVIRDLRSGAGLSQAELAQRVGTTQAYISDLERGNGRLGPSFALLLSIAKACDDDLVLMSESEFSKVGKESRLPVLRGIDMAQDSILRSRGKQVLIAGKTVTIYDVKLPKSGAKVLINGEPITIHGLTFSKRAPKTVSVERLHNVGTRSHKKRLEQK